MAVKTKKITAAKHFEEIFINVSWAKLARDYFDKSSSWIYNKLKGIDGNGGEDEFTDTEKHILRNALYEISDKIRDAADGFD